MSLTRSSPATPASLPDGGVRALIVAVDDGQRRLAYAVVETRMPLAHPHASFQVFADGAWITDALPHERATDIRLRVERGAEIMKQTLEAAITFVKQQYPSCHVLQLTVHPENTRAQQLYSCVDFQPTGHEVDGEPLYRLLVA